MKNSLLILILSGISLSGYSQDEHILRAFSRFFPKDLSLIDEVTFPSPSVSNQLVNRTNQHQPIRETYWNWDGTTDTLKQTSRYLHAYDPSGKLINSVYQKWAGGQWRDEFKLIQVYNSHYQLLTYQFEFWANHSWTPYYRTLHFYNDDQIMIERVQQTWLEEKWMNVQRELIELNAILNFSKETNQYWSDDGWMNQYQYIEYFNESGKTRTRVHQKWDGNHWIYEISEVFNYGDDQLLGEVLVEEWKNDHWGNAGIYYYTYDQNRNNLSITFNHTDPLESEMDFKWDFEYDDANNLIKDSFSSRKNGQWEYDIRNIHSYDESNKISLLTQLWTGNWQDQEYIVYEYDVVKDTVSDIPGLLLYPNPSKDEMDIVLPEDIECPCHISITGIDGKNISVASAEADAGVIKLPINSLIPGWYNLRLLSQNNHLSQPFIKD